MNLLNPLAGFLVGALVGATGVGGGAFMTPILVFVLGVAPKTAVGTDLLFASITKSVGVWVYGARGSIDWRVLSRLAAGSLPAATLTLIFLTGLRDLGRADTLILQALGVALAATGVGLLLKAQLHALGRRLRTDRPTRFKRSQPVLTVLAGFVIGSLVTLTSVGAGALGMVALAYLYPYRLTPRRLVGTDIAHAIPLTLLAGLGHASLGNIDLRLLGSLLIGSVPGVVVGSLLSNHASEHYVRYAIAAVLLVTGTRLMFGP
jgi:uncharacterized protein